MTSSILHAQKEKNNLKDIPFVYYFIPVTAAFLLGLSHLLWSTRVFIPYFEGQRRSH